MPFAELFHEQGKHLCLIYIMLQQNGRGVIHSALGRKANKRIGQLHSHFLLCNRIMSVNILLSCAGGERSRRRKHDSRVIRLPHDDQSFVGRHRKAYLRSHSKDGGALI